LKLHENLTALALGALAVGALGCVGTTSDELNQLAPDSDDGQGGRRGPGKADGLGLPGTCGELTSGMSPDGCYCDEQCCHYGDCCEDRIATCGGGDDACFLGPERDGSVCLPARPLPEPVPADQVFPSECEASYGAAYRPPSRYLDLEELDGGLRLAPELTLADVAAASETDRYMVFQPHALARLQDIWDRIGPLQLVGTYRSPGWNASLPGRAGCSRHMYGDAIDIIPLEASVSDLDATCRQLSASFVKTYPQYGFVHCDWRDVPLDASLFP